MLKKISAVICLLGGLLALLQCQKGLDDQPVGPIEGTLLAFSSVDTGNVFISKEEVPVIRIFHNQEIVSTGRGGEFVLPIDVDGDEIPDFEFRLDSWFQMSGDGWSKASVAGIHGTFELNVFTTQDTTFQSDNYLARDGSYWNKKVAVIDTRTYSCRRMKETDLIFKKEITRHVSHYETAELKNPTSEWTSEEVFFRNSRSHSSFLYDQKQNADTIWFLQNDPIEINDCHVFPSYMTFIWIRYSVDGFVKPGWIKLIAEPGHITILESEILK